MTYPLIKFSDVITLSTSRTADPSSAGIDRFVGLEHIEPENLHIRSWGNVADGTTFTNTFKRGQVLFGKRRAYQRKVAVADFDGVCSGDIYVFESKDPNVLLPELVPFILQSEGFYQYAVKTSAGSLSPRTNWTHLANYELNVPPVDEQRRIADLLWAADDAIQQNANALSKLEILLKSSLDDVFVDGGRYEDISESLTLGDIIEVKHGYAYKSEFFSSDAKDMPILVTPGSFTLDGRLYFSDNTKYYTDTTPPEFILAPGDLLVVLTDLTPDSKLLGNPAFVTSGKTYLQNQRIGKIVIHDSQKVDTDFLYFFMLSRHYKQRIKSTATGSTVRHTSPTSIKRISLNLPSLQTQKLISAKLKQLNETRYSYQLHLEKTKDLLKVLVNQSLPMR